MIDYRPHMRYIRAKYCTLKEYWELVNRILKLGGNFQACGNVIRDDNGESVIVVYKSRIVNVYKSKTCKTVVNPYYNKSDDEIIELITK